MATVNKDFRIKAGLVVEGANATVNGEDIITTGSSTDNLQEGTTNKYFTDQRAIDAVATEIDTAVSTAVNALTTTDIEEGTNLYFTNQRAIDAGDGVFDAYGAASTAQTNAESYADSAISTAVAGLAPNYITSTTSEFSVTDGELSIEQLNGSTQINPASGAQPNNGYATVEYTDADTGTEGLKIKSEKGWVGGNVGGNLDIDAYKNVNITSRNADIVLNADGSSYLWSAASGNEIATKGYVDGLAGNYDAAGSASQALTDANSYTDTAVSNIVGAAPELLNTLEELATALQDNPDIISNLQDVASGKQDILTAGTGIDITGSTISVTTNTYDAYGAASTAEANANDYTDTAISGLSTVYDANGAASSALTSANGYTDTAISGLSSVYDALGAAGTAETNANAYTDQALDDVTNGITAFTEVNINAVASQVAATQTVASAATVTALNWAKADFKSAKLTVKAATTTNSQVSEVLVTIDSSNNVAITEFGIVYTDVELATVTADVSGSDVRIRVTTLSSSTDVTVIGTLLV